MNKLYSLWLLACLSFYVHTISAQNYNNPGGTTNTCAGTFFDTGGNGGVYGSSQNITTTFCSNNGNFIQFSFTAFDLESGWDFLTIYNGPNATSPSLGTFTGTTSPGTVTSTGTCLTFVFTSDGSVENAGWRATISCTTVAPPLGYNNPGGTINTCAGTFYDTGGSTGTYAAGQNITTTICSNNGNTVRLTFSAFDLENNFDFLSVYNGGTATAPLIGTYTGTTSPGTVTSTGQCLTFVFTSDGSVQNAGWAAAISCTSTPVPTGYNNPGGTINTCSGLFFDTGGSGGTYGSSQNITTTICSSTPGLCLRTAFTSFNTESGFDILSIYDGTNTSGTLLGNYSGTTSPGTITSGTGCLTFRFVSDGSVTLGGWEANISCVSCPSASPCPAGTGLPDNCNQACNLGTLPAPPACGTGIQTGTIVSNVLTNIGATAPNPYSSVTDCGGIPGNNMASPAADVWYRITVTGTQLLVNLQGFGSTPLQNPNIGIYQGSSCNALLPVFCAVGSGGVINQTFEPVTPGTTYYIQVSGGSPTDQGNFTLNLSNNYDCANCLLNGILTATPAPTSGTYPANTTVNYCFTVNTYNQTAANWLHGIIIEPGPGWNLASLTPVSSPNPCETDVTASWAWYNSITGTATGQTWGPGFFYDDDSGGGGFDGDPGNNFGDPAAGISCTLTYCWSISTPSGACIDGADLSMNVNTTGDYESGSWGSSGCLNDPEYNIVAELSCCPPPTMTSTNTSCGINNGTATATPGAAGGPFSYHWENAAGTTVLNQNNIAGASTLSNLSAGQYFVTVTNAAGCESYGTSTITNGGGSLVPAASANTPICAGQTLNLVATGGISYAWSGPNSFSSTAATPSISNAQSVNAGTYTVTVTAGAGCTGTASVTVTISTALTVSSTGTSVSCNGGSNGSITVTASGGTTPYSYNRGTGNQASNIFTGLAAGTYTITVTSAAGCTATTTFTITQPAALTASSIGGNVLCNGGNNGSMTVTASGGTSPYSYNRGTGSQASNTFSNLIAGIYTVTVTDARGCTATTSYTVTQLAAVTGTTTGTAVACNGGSTGTITVFASGGLPAYTYNVGLGNQPSNVIGGLAVGTYIITITDSRGCTGTATSYTVTQPSVLTVSSSGTNASCNGGNNGSITVSPSGGTMPYVYNRGVGIQNTPLFSSLPAGSYTVTVTDQRGCTATTSYTVTQPAVLSASSTGTNSSCNGSNNGSMTITATGGTSPYSYNRGTGSQASNIFSGLVAGAYTVTVTDARGCTTTSSYTVTQPTALTASAVGTNVSCNGSNNGSMTITATGGTSPYSYNRGTGGQASNVFSGLVAGAYTVTVTDALGCTTTSSYTVTQPAALTASAVGTNVSCNGGNNGSMTITTTGGTSPYSYNRGTGGQASNVFSGLAAGAYTVTVTDALGCTTTSSYTVTQPAALTAIAVGINVSCNGGNNGSMTITATGGTSPYSYNRGTGNQASNVFSGLAAGAYTVTVTDALGCTTTSSYTVTQPTALATTAVGTNVSCNGGNTGSMTITATGSTSPYSYNRGTGSQASNIFSGLAAGAYTVTVTDALGCTTTSSYTVTQPAALTASAVGTNVSCNGGNNGSMIITATGGTSPYSYNRGTGGQASNVFSGLAAGAYTVTVTDALGCTTTSSYIVTQPAALTASAVGTNVSCNGGNNGSMTITATGGTSPYSYNRGSGNQASNVFSGLAAGAYTVTVTDALGCTTTSSYTVTQPTALAATAVGTNVSCNGGNTGSITITATGGTSPYSYNRGTGSQASNIFSGLAAGAYTVTVTDALGCTTTSSYTVTQPTTLTASAVGTNVSCNGGNNGSMTVTATGGTSPYSYNRGTGSQASNVFSGLAAGAYTVTVTDALGCTTTSSYTVTQPAALTASAVVTNVSCNGGNNGSMTVTATGGTSPYSYNRGTGGQASNVFSGLVAGAYTVTVTDALGCTTTSSYTVTQPAALAATSVQDSVNCFSGNDGSITVTANGGTPSYSYNLGSGAQASPILTNLAAGNYTITVTDLNGCTATTSVTVLQPTQLTATSVQDSANCFGGSDGSITVTVNGGTPGYNYNLGSGAQASPVLTNLAAGNYTITVTDFNGCTATTSVTVLQPTQLTATSVQDSVNCFSGNDGSITVTTNGGTASYSYNLGNGAQASPILTNLAAGNYTITVTDFNGCTATTSVTVLQPTQLTATSVQDSVNCFGGTDGSITVTANGGTPGYSYNLGSGAQASPIFSNLAAGNYTITVTDLNGCTATTSVTVLQPTQLTATSVQDSVNCFGGTDGSITVTANGGTPGYSYNLGSGAQASPTFTNLVAGNYTITITDLNGCTATTSVTVLQPTQLTATSVQDSVNCFGGTDGTITVTANGGTLDYSYNLGSGAQASPILTNLAAGNYTITVTDLNGCTATTSVTVLQPTQLTATSVQDSVNCFGGTDGTITVTANGGTLDYSYNLGSGAQASPILTNLAAGNYTITVTDLNGCTATTSVTVLQPTQLTATSVQDSVNCFSGNDGSITVTTNGGTASYSYNLGNGAQASPILTNLAAGNYTITVTDFNGCTATTSVTVLQPTQLTATSVQDSVNCFGGTDGSITVTTNGGTPGYNYNLGSGAQASPIFSNLAAGNYTITVTDLNGCTATTSVTVLQPTQLTATSVQDSVNCFGGTDGSITVTANGGTPGYSYNLGSGAQASPTFTNLVAGNYTITITDLNGCTATTSVTVLQPTQLTATSVQDSVNCFSGNDGSSTVTTNGGTASYSYNLGNGAQASPILTNLAAGNYTITVTDFNGCTATTSVTVLEPTQLTATSVQDSVNCFGGTDGSITVTANGGTPGYSYNLGSGAQASPIFTNLIAGNYTITITDLNGCTATTSVTVLQPTQLTATSVQDSVNCFGGSDGSITVTANGGTLGYSYNLGNSAQASPVLTNLVAGNYTITLTDLNGCTATTSVTVLQPTQLTATSVQDSVNCFGGSDGSITVTANGGTPGYSYNLGNGAQASPVLTNLVAGNYTITLTDLNGCTATTSVTVLQPTQLTATSVQDSVNCFGGSDGSITVTANGGTPGYSYNLGSGAQASPMLTNLSTGNYTITVTDLNGCTATTSVTVLQPTQLTATSVQDSVNCFGGSDGSITVTANGGTPGYSYKLGSGAQASPILTNLAAGNYTITVTDLNGCTATTSVTVLQPIQLTATSVQDSVNCFGGNDGSATITASGGIPTYTYNIGSGAQASPILTNLAAGNYTITLTDLNGCTATTSVTVLQPTQLTATSVQDSVNCFGGNDGSTTITASGGIPTYTYTLGGGAQVSPIFSNLATGNYTITVTDLNGCTATTSVTMLQPTQLTATSVQDSVNCFGGSDGSITVTANGGTLGYSYNLGNGAQASPVLTNLVAGNYTITVTDLNGCTATTSVTVLQPIQLTATSVQDSVNCFGGSDGSITVTANGGTPGYSYNLGSGAQASPMLTNLSTGNYTITVTDLNGCTATTSVTVLQPTQLTATSVQDSVNCFGGSDGSITVTANGGTPGYSYNLGSGAQASPILTNLAAGNYTITVTDFNGCTATTSVTVLQPTQLTATSVQDSVTCFGGNDGSITVTTNGGTASYSYNLGNGAQASPILTNLAAGNYTITITDLNGCTATTSVTVLQPTQPTATSIQDSVNCFGGNDGSITVTANGGTPGYSYNLGSGAQASPMLTNLSTGNYTITVTDLNGCTATTSVTVLQPTQLTATSVQDSVTCFGGTDGSITVTTNGGTPGYNYNLGSGAQASPIFSSLAAGNYTITVTDLNGCTATTSVTVLQPTQLTATSVQDSVNCFSGNDGSITVTTNGGTASYSYNLGNGAQASPILTNLAAGNYTITVTDFNGCTATTSVTVLQPTQLTATSVQDSVNCFGGTDGSTIITASGGIPTYTYTLGGGAQVSPTFSNLVAGNYTITITDLNGCTATTSVTVLQPTQPTATSIQDSVNCFGGNDGSITVTTNGGTPSYSYNLGNGAQASPVLTNLAAGNYTITVTDFNGCTATTSVTVLQPTQLTATSVQDSVNCFSGNDGSITVTTNGGTASYSYNLGNGAQASPILTNLAAGNYTITVTDFNGCTATTSVTVLQPTQLTATSVQDSVNCFGGTDGSTTITASGGIPTYTYTLGGGAQASPTFTNLVAGNYTITITDLNGCTATTSVTVLQPTQPTATSIQDSVNCFGGNDGSITVTTNGGTPSYSYNLGNGAQASPVLTNLAAGNYTITVTDFNGCTATTSVTVLQPTQLTATSVQDSVTCFGGNDGSITVTASGGTPSYSYNLGNGAQASPVLTNLVAGNYTITVTDFNGCTATATVTVLQPTQLTATSVQDSVTCFGGTDGSITVTTNGGTPGYNYNLGSGAQASPIFSNLAAGNYTITVTDLNGCTATTSVTVLQPTQLTATSVQDSVNCFGGTDGSITVTANGGTPGYSYNLGSGAQSSPIFTNLSAGNYTITMTDLNSCTATTSVTVLQPTQLTATSVQDSVNCFGGNDGSITLTANGGTLDYSYNLGSGAQASPILTNLAAGNYIITVTDLNGCTATTSVTVLQPTQLTATSVQDSVNCFSGNDGSITVTTNGGTASYSYNLGNGAQASPVLTNLVAGNYTITVTDFNGCTATTSVTVLQPTQLTATSVQDSVTCFGGTDGSITVTANGGTPGYSYNLGSGAQASPIFTNLAAGNYTITVTDFNGCTATSSVTVLQPTQLTATSVQDSVNCFGGNDGSTTITASGGIPTYTYNIGSGAQASPIFTNLAAGNYTITLTDFNGCTATFSVTVLQPTQLTATSVQDSVNCFAGNDGSITVTANGGTSSYTYNLGNGAQTSPVLTNLVAGNYTITVTDFNGCTATSSVTVLQPIQLTATSVQDSVNCFGGTDGSITVTANGGTPGYNYNLGSGAQSSPIFTNLAAGNYTITVTDLNGCTATTSVTVLQPTQLTATSLQDSVNCFGGSEGSITVTTNGGTPSYSYNLGSSAQASPVFTNLGAGNYTTTVTDFNGCTATTSVTVLEPTQLTATSVQDSVNCFGGTDGSITVTANGGTPGYSYNLGSGAQASPIFTNLAAGNYTITVTDFNGCTATSSVTVLQPTQLTATSVQDSVNCFGGNDGSTTITSSGGIPTYSYNIGGGAQASPIFTGLVAGAYTVIITDLQGCTATLSLSIFQPQQLVASATAQAALCNGSATGSITVNTSNSTAPFAYNIGAGFQSSNIFTGLSAGTYTITVSDGNACTTSVSASITEPTPLNMVLGSTNVTCNGGSNGIISVAATGGTAPYSYTRGAGLQTSNQFTALVVGTYTITVIDANGCSISQSITIQEPAPLSASLVTSNASCYGQADGAAQINLVTGGIAPYQISWSNAAVGNLASNLSSGAYTVSIVDANNCLLELPFNILSPAPIQIFTSALSNVTCFGAGNGFISVNPQGGQAPYLYSWSNGSSTAAAQQLTPGLYFVTVTDAQGCSASNAIGFAISEPTPLSLNVLVVDTVTCFGYTDAALEAVATGSTAPYSFSWSNAVNTALNLNLGVGTYTVTVTDAQNCTAIASAILTQPVPLQASFEVTNPICSYDFGSISILVDSTSGPAPYIYSTDGGLLFGSGNVALGLSGGIYNIVVQDLNGCSFTTQATVTTPASIQVSITPASSVMELGTSVELTASTVSQGSLQYLWTPSTGLSCNDCSNPVANPTETSTYSLLVTDADGCTATATAVVQVDPVRNVYIPTAFTPNGDGNNDMFTVFASNGVVRVERLIIADRWGNIVFDRAVFAPNDPTLGWDGTYKGLMMNASTLVYYVEVLFEDGKTLPYKGDVTLIR